MILKHKLNINYLLLILGFSLELGVLTFLKNQSQYYFLPLVGATGAILSIVALYRQSRLQNNNIISSTNSSIGLKWLVYLLYAIASFAILRYVFSYCTQYPAVASECDIVPTLETMAHRVINNQYPFAEISYGTYAFAPGYLPAQFLPFVPAQLLHLDFRFWAVCIFLISIFIYLSSILKANNNILEIIIKLLLPLVALALIMHRAELVIRHSVEFLDVAYYIILGFSIFSKNKLIQAFAICMCLLSRYGILLWLPTYAIIYIMHTNWKSGLQIIGMVVVGVLALYVVPYMRQDPMLFFNSISNYSTMAIDQWEPRVIWSDLPTPYTLSQGFGFAIYFSEFAKGSALQKIELIKNTQLVMCIIACLACGWYYFKHKHSLDTNFYLLFTFKLFLFIFYAFMFVPFSYLYIVPILISLVPLFKINLFVNAK